MPHFVMDCSETVLNLYEQKFICEQIHLVALDTGLFVESEIKVRLNPFKTYSVGNNKETFIHVFAHIMQGRTTIQKANLSKEVVAKLTNMFPSIEHIAMNIADFEKATYCNHAMLKVI
jgi:5-carboxymethyl-2-hydroxymuconate isomerase